MSIESRTPEPRRRRVRALRLEPGQALPTQQLLRFTARFDPRQRYFVYIPASGGRQAPIFVTVHGLSRNANKHAKLFASYCERHDLVLVAPVFSKRRSADYQRLGRASRGARADKILESILEEVSHLTGASSGPVHMFGFSAGGQFVHRFAMAHPHRVAGAAVASAGWYTFPDAGKRFPYGTRAGRSLPGLRFDPEAFLKVPITVIVGDQDTATTGLRNTERVNRHQGTNRLERSRNWVSAMHGAASEHQLQPMVQLDLVPGGDHSFNRLMKSGKLGDRVFAALFREAVAVPANGSAANGPAVEHG